jgi:NAD(P)-dependent dehydrogenase (short-subunit alcohol dehydrogenase family)
MNFTARELLKNQVAIITGSSRGIGRETALLFVQEGAKVVINYKQHQELAEVLQKQIGDNNAIVVQADVSNEDDVKKLVSATKKHFGRIDILVNNAGAIYREPSWRSNAKTWTATIDTNLTGAWLMCKEVSPLMQKNKSGTIVNISSIYGIVGVTSDLSYSVAKGGLITLTKALAKELAPMIRVNAVAPGNVMTEMTNEANKKIIKLIEQNTPLHRSAKPSEIANAILFLVSDMASYITGQVLAVDGGYCLK